MAKVESKELKINPAWCKGCGICVAFCNQSALEMVNGKVQLKKENNCILCGLCELRCPDYAIFVEETEGETGQWVK
ncbi:MAG: 4Fe-4S binding protein [Firmicutes bacterium]|nr:4Fe-4S binding protein [Bacillota bacterium]